MRSLLLAILTLNLAGAAADNGGRVPLKMEQLIDLTDVRQITPSPDGKFLALELAVSNPAFAGDTNIDLRGSVRLSINLVEVATGKATPLGDTSVETCNAVWSPQGDALVYQTGVDDESRLWLWDRQTGASRRISNLAPRRIVSQALWLPDGRRLVVPILPEGVSNDDLRLTSGLTGTDADYPLDKATPGARVALYRAGPQAGEQAIHDFARNNSRRSDLALVDAGSGEYRRLAAGYRPVSYTLSPDGRHLAFATAVGQAEGSGYRNLYDLYVVDTAGGTPRRLARHVSQIGVYMHVRWSPDGAWLAYADSGPGGKNEIGFIEVATGTIRTAPLPVANTRLVPPLWSRDGSEVYLLTEEGLLRARLAGGPADFLAKPAAGLRWAELFSDVQAGTVAANRSGEIIIRVRGADGSEGFQALSPGSGATRFIYRGPFAIEPRSTQVSAQANLICFARQSTDACPQAWISDLDFGMPRQISRLNPQLEGIPMGLGRLVEWRGLEGTRMQGAFLTPPGKKPDAGWPVVVYLYGDSAVSHDLNFFGFNNLMLMPYDNMQLLASRGYAVFLPDTRTRAGTPMADIAAGITPAIDRLVELGLADPQRFGIMGRSYGGYSVMSVLVQSARFRAAISVCGQSNLLAVYREMKPDGTTWKISWAEEAQGKLGGTPWTARERYIENSPFFYLDRVTTPVLIAHGTKDTAVAVEAGDELFLSLRRLGKTVEFAKYLDEPHVIHGRANSIDYGNRMIGWFERHLGPGH